MTVVDCTTKWRTLVAVHESITAVEAADLFFLWVVRPFGVPQEIMSDRDPRLMSHFWQQFFAHLGIHLLHSTAHHPQMDGKSEQAHRMIEQVLHSYVLGCLPDKWVDLLLFCKMSLNGYLQSSTQRMPNALTYGQELHQPLDLAGGMGPEAPTATEVAATVQEKLDLAC